MRIWVLLAIYAAILVQLWFVPKPFRPWVRVGILVVVPYYVVGPRRSLFVWLVMVMAFVLVQTFRRPDDFQEL